MPASLANTERVMKERSVMLKVKRFIRMRARSFSKLSGRGARAF